MADPSGPPRCAPVWCFHPSFADFLDFSHGEKSSGAQQPRRAGQGISKWREGILERGKSPFNIISFNIWIFKWVSVFGSVIIGAMNCAWILVDEMTGKTVFLQDSGGGRRRVRHCVRKSY